MATKFTVSATEMTIENSYDDQHFQFRNPLSCCKLHPHAIGEYVLNYQKFEDETSSTLETQITLSSQTMVSILDHINKIAGHVKQETQQTTNLQNQFSDDSIAPTYMDQDHRFFKGQSQQLLRDCYTFKALLCFFFFFHFIHEILGPRRWIFLYRDLVVATHLLRRYKLLDSLVTTNLFS